MARGLNKVQIIGNLGNDPDVRYMPNGNPVVTISIATTDTWKDKDSGEKKENTQWHRIIFFNKLAEIVAEYLKKGGQVYVEGSLRNRKYTDKNNIERYITEIIGRDMQMLGGKKQDESDISSSTIPSFDEQDIDDKFGDDIPF